MISSNTRRRLLLTALASPLLIVDVTPALASTVWVGSASELDRALANATSGTTIVLRNSVTFSKGSEFIINRNGANNSLIRIVAERNQTARMRSTLTINGNYIQVEGLRFDNASVNINGDNCQVIACGFSGTNGRIKVNGAINANINNNEFRGWGPRCIAFNPFNSGRGRNPRIYGNYFHDSSNVCVALGFQHRHQPLNVGALVENNLFVNCTHDQTINCKSSGNRIRGNTMSGGGAFVCRFGLNNVFENNWMENCKGIWTADKGCLVSGNRLTNSDIWVLAGDVTSAQTAGKEGSHPRSETTRLTNNVARQTVVDMAWRGFNLPAMNTIVEGHNGRIQLSNQQGTQVRSTDNRNAGSAARRLNQDKVGPGAVGSTPVSAPSSSNPPAGSNNSNAGTNTSSSSNSGGDSSDGGGSSSGQPSISGHECVGDPAAILKTHSGENAWVVSEMYHKKSVEYYNLMRSQPYGSTEYNTYRTLFAACRDVNQLADSMARSGVRTL